MERIRGMGVVFDNTSGRTTLWGLLNFLGLVYFVSLPRYPTFANSANVDDVERVNSIPKDIYWKVILARLAFATIFEVICSYLQRIFFSIF